MKRLLIPAVAALSLAGVTLAAAQTVIVGPRYYEPTYSERIYVQEPMGSAFLVREDTGASTPRAFLQQGCTEDRGAFNTRENSCW
jgi:hypothetical protein